MNAKLLQTRLNSITHYKNEIMKLEEAIRITRQTRQELVNSLSEFCDLTEGDLIIRNGIFYKFLRIQDVHDSLNINLVVETQISEYGKGYSWREKIISIPIIEMPNCKVLGNVHNDSFKN